MLANGRKKLSAVYNWLKQKIGGKYKPSAPRQTKEKKYLSSKHDPYRKFNGLSIMDRRSQVFLACSYCVLQWDVKHY